MLLHWLDARAATRVGATLADDVVMQQAAGSRAAARGDSSGRVQKVLQRFLQRVDRETRALELNLFKRAKLANSFKWRLLEKGIDREIADELTQALILRLTPSQGSESRPAQSNATPAGRGRSRERHAELLAQGEEHLTRGAHAEALQCYQESLSLDPRNA